MNTFKQLSRGLTREPGSPSIDEATQFGDLLASLLTMAWFVEARDPYTGGHLWRVSRYAWLLAEGAGFSSAKCAQSALGGFLHDLGKVGVPDAILRKADSLNDDEYAVIKTHSEIGLRMLSGHPLAHVVCDAVLFHHERPDGQGYPRGLTGDAIPTMGRIVAIGDAFDAMTSQRPYRPGMPRETATAIIRALRGAQFDAHLADIFVALSDAGGLDHVIGHSDSGIPLLSCPICGPTILVRDEQNEGDPAYCRNCGGKFALKMRDSGIEAALIGGPAPPAELEPEADNALIARTVKEAVAAIPIADLMAATKSP
jgi:DNA-directed RNA polymerase subunit RPC12/RpoP